TSSRERKTTLVEATFAVMERAYLQASDNGTLPVTPRQIMYVARGPVHEMTGKTLTGSYFTQTLLPQYLAEHDVDWDIVHDDRGHFREPHTGREIGVGTLNVRDYLGDVRGAEVHDGGLSDANVSTRGPDARFGAVLFIEKEGFLPLFEHVRLCE